MVLSITLINFLQYKIAITLIAAYMVTSSYVVFNTELNYILHVD